MNPVQHRRIRQALLVTLIAAVAFATLLGLGAVFGSGGSSQSYTAIPMLVTTVLIALACGNWLCCAAALEAGRAWILAWVGLVLTALATLLLIGSLWDWDIMVNPLVGIALAVLAVACAQVCGLSLARLAEAFRWALPTARVLIGSVATLIAVQVLELAHGETISQLTALGMVLVLAITLLIPIFHLMSKRECAASTPLDEDAELATLHHRLQEIQGRIAELEQRRQ